MQCLDCERPMVPISRRQEKQPGGVVHKSRGLCAACHQRAARNGVLGDFRPRTGGDQEPEATPESIARTRIELTDYIRARRTRLAG